MSINAIGTGLSGMQGFQNALNVSANNVANSLTKGFKPQQAQFTEARPAGTGINVTATPPQPAGGTQGAGAPPTGGTATAVGPKGGNAANLPPSGTNLTNEMVNQLTYAVGYDASANVVKRADQAVGSLLHTTA